MRKHIYTGAMGSAYFVLLAGVFLQTFAREIGVSLAGMGRLMGLSLFALALYPVGAYVTTRTGKRRAFWFYTAVGARICRAGGIVALFYLAPVNFPAACWAFIGLSASAHALGAMSAPPWFSWLADIIPAEKHGDFMGRRQAWTGLLLAAVVLPLAYLAQRMSAEGMGGEAMMALFAVGFGLGVLDLFIHRTIPEPRLPPQPGRRLMPQVLNVLRDRTFRPVLLFKCAWGFSMTLGGAMSILYVVEYLEFRRDLFVTTLVLIALPQVSLLLTSRHLGRLVDRFGCRRTLWWSHLVWTFCPVGLLAMRPGPHVVWWLAAFFLVTGPACHAAMNAEMKLTTRLPGREDRCMYVAVSTCLAAVAAGAGALAAGQVLEALEGWSCHVGGAGFVGYHVLFVASFFLRLASTALIRRLPGAAAERARIQLAGRPTPMERAA